MTGILRKSAIVIFIVLGGLVGFWLAKENQRLFELPYREEHSQPSAERPFGELPEMAVGMDTWQVKEALGPPEKRDVISEDGHGKQEVWTYRSRRLHFENGFLTRWED